MIRHITYALISTLTIATGFIFFKQKPKLWFYVLFFLGLIAIDVLFDKLEANDSFYQNFEMQCAIPNATFEIEVMSGLLAPIECLTAQQRSFYEKKLKERRFDAERTWNNAKNKCWFLPKRDYRDISRSCFGVAIAMIGGATPMSKIVCMLIASLSAYGMAAIDEWYYIEEQLNWCQYHCEMVEFYLTVLEKG